jgi:hypothetical protein
MGHQFMWNVFNIQLKLIIFGKISKLIKIVEIFTLVLINYIKYQKIN